MTQSGILRLEFSIAPSWLCSNASGYVGIRNGGATCYMNSVFQQLFMQPSIRRLILGGPEDAPDMQPDSVFYQMQVGVTEDVLTIVNWLQQAPSSADADRKLAEQCLHGTKLASGFVIVLQLRCAEMLSCPLRHQQESSLCALKALQHCSTCAPVHAQAIFGHLALGQNEAVNPRSFWRAFRDYDGSPINVREHQDAYEFFTRLQVKP